MLRFLQVVGIFAVFPLALFIATSAALGSFSAGWRFTRLWAKHIGAMLLVAALLTMVTQ
jgi:hypothetical protein